jgi:hypothetical protein
MEICSSFSVARRLSPSFQPYLLDLIWYAFSFDSVTHWYSSSKSFLLRLVCIYFKLRKFKVKIGGKSVDGTDEAARRSKPPDPDPSSMGSLPMPMIVPN